MTKTDQQAVQQAVWKVCFDQKRFIFLNGINDTIYQVLKKDFNIWRFIQREPWNSSTNSCCLIVQVESPGKISASIWPDKEAGFLKLELATLWANLLLPMNGNSSAQLESAELGSRSCEGNAFRRGGKIVGYTSNLPKAMRMLFNNNCNRNSKSNRNNNNLETLGQLLKSALLIDVECCGFGYDIW